LPSQFQGIFVWLIFFLGIVDLDGLLISWLVWFVHRLFTFFGWLYLVSFLAVFVIPMHKFLWAALGFCR
jgi:hypothetical protein